jgi:hypothetical protein
LFGQSKLETSVLSLKFDKGSLHKGSLHEGSLQKGSLHGGSLHRGSLHWINAISTVFSFKRYGSLQKGSLHRGSLHKAWLCQPRSGEIH